METRVRTRLALSLDGWPILSSRYRSIRMLDANTTGATKTTGQVDFTDQPEIKDKGLICGSNNELLMRIPRANLHRPSSIWVTGETETCLDLSVFVHRHSWGTCIST